MPTFTRSNLCCCCVCSELQGMSAQETGCRMAQFTVSLDSASGLPASFGVAPAVSRLNVLMIAYSQCLFAYISPHNNLSELAVAMPAQVELINSQSHIFSLSLSLSLSDIIKCFTSLSYLYQQQGKIIGSQLMGKASSLTSSAVAQRLCKLP
jgi:hypothetical protein